MLKSVKDKDVRFAVLLGTGMLVVIGAILIFVYTYFKPAKTSSETIITQHDGEYITFAGYISPYSPEDGSFAFITATPYNGTPSESTTTVKGVFPARVYPPADMMFMYTSVPVAVTGRVKCLDGKYTDDYGVECDWYLENGTITPLTALYSGADEMPANLLAYHNIASNGLCEAAYTALLAVDYDLHYAAYGGSTDSLEVYSTDVLLTALQFESLINTDECSQLCEIIVHIGDCLNNLNICIADGNYEKLSEYEQDYYTAYREFYDWCDKFRITDEILSRM